MVLRKSIEIYMDDQKVDGPDGIKQALTYVLPQINATPSVIGFLPTQWLLGRQVQLPGDVTGKRLSPAHFDSHNKFEMLLQKRNTAKQKRNTAKYALLQAETDTKLCRALLRQYQETNLPLEVGPANYASFGAMPKPVT